MEYAVNHAQPYTFDAAPQELTFLVISQKEPKSIRNAERLRSSILLQAQIEAAERNIEVNLSSVFVLRFFDVSLMFELAYEFIISHLDWGLANGIYDYVI